MSLTRPIVFWIAMLAALITAVVLLREVLLPSLPVWCWPICLTPWLPGWSGWQ